MKSKAFQQLLPFLGERPIINVSQVRKLSPFRYPGGKTWLFPYIRIWLSKIRPEVFIEPFAGGANIGLNVAFERLSHQVILVEIDPDVAAVWKTVFHGDADWLINRIREFRILPKTVKEILKKEPQSVEEQAFQTILRNRISHGGILAKGAGIMRHGENGKGIASRWYPETLIKRIKAIKEIKDRIIFIEGDGFKIIEEHIHKDGIAFYIDPPYLGAGKRLYRYSRVDHDRLFLLTSQARGAVLLSYDDCSEIRALARRYGFDIVEIPMQNRRNQRQVELLIGRELKRLL